MYYGVTLVYVFAVGAGKESREQEVPEQQSLVPTGLTPTPTPSLTATPPPHTPTPTPSLLSHPHPDSTLEGDQDTTFCLVQ